MPNPGKLWPKTFFWKHTKVFEIEEVLKTDNTEDEDDSENFNSKKKLKYISNTDKETHE